MVDDMTSNYILQYYDCGWMNEENFSFSPRGLKLAKKARETLLEDNYILKRRETRIIETHYRVLKNYETFYTNEKNKKIV